MSYREQRLLIETMKALGYPRLISIESFRLPNFELVADILYWLVQRHDPSAGIDDDVRTEAARIAFLKSIAEVLQVKLRLKLDCKSLYLANGFAARELLKLARVLQHAMDMRTLADDDRDLRVEEVQAFDSAKARLAAAELAADGATLGHLLQAEATNGDRRARVVARLQEVAQVERAAAGLIERLKGETARLGEALLASQADEGSLRAKVEARRAQRDRAAKQLRALEATRPAHQEEYDRLEGELAQRFAGYLEHLRNLEFLEAELRKHTVVEERLVEEQQTKLRLLRDRLRREELTHLQEADRMEEEAVMRGAADRAADAPTGVAAPAPRPAASAGPFASYLQARQPPPAAESAQAAMAAANQARPASGRRQRQPPPPAPQPAAAFLAKPMTFARNTTLMSEDGAARNSDSEMGDSMAGDDEMPLVTRPSKLSKSGGDGGEGEEEEEDEEDDDNDDSDDDEDDSDASDDDGTVEEDEDED